MKFADKLLRIGVVGTGSAGSRHLSALSKIDGVVPVAVPKRTSMHDVLKSEGVCVDLSQGLDACIIASDTSLHVSDSLKLLGITQTLLIEKPLAARLREAELLWKEVKGLQNRIFIGCVLRFSESLLCFREWLPKIGKRNRVRIFCHSYLPDWRPERDYRESYSARKKEGGVLRDLIHEVDLAGWIFGWPLKVQGELKNLNRLGIEADEEASLSWRESSGALLTVDLDYVTRPTKRGICAMGEAGTLRWDAVTREVHFQGVNGEPEIFQSRQSRESLFDDQASAFVDFVREGKKSQMATLEEGMKTMLICDPLWEAFESYGMD